MSEIEAAVLSELEAIIQQAYNGAAEALQRHDHFLMEGAIAAGKIRALELYKPEHKSFEAYCQERWGWTKAKAFRQLAWAKELEGASEIEVARATWEPELPPTPSQRAAVAARRIKADEAKEAARREAEATATDDPSGKRPEVVQPEQPSDQVPEPNVDDSAVTDPELVQPLDETAAALAQALGKLEALELENQLLRDELERPLQGSVVHVAPPEADFMAQLAEALEMSLDHPPATLLVKVRSLMTERAKRKPAKKSDQPLAAVRTLPTTRPPATRREVEPMFKKGAR